MTRRLAVTAIGRSCAPAGHSHREARSTPRETVHRVRRVLALAVSAIALTFGLAQRAAAEITVTEIAGPVAGCEPVHIAETGDVLIQCGEQRAYVYSPQTQVLTLIVPPDPADTGFISVRAMNNSGVVAGQRWNLAGTESSTFVWTRATGAQSVTTPSTIHLVPAALNDLGEMLLVNWSSNRTFPVALRRADGTLITITTRPFHGYGYPGSLNNLSQVPMTHDGFGVGIWSPTQGIVELPPAPPSLTYPQLLALNDAGIAAGVGLSGSGIFVYTPSTGYNLLAGVNYSSWAYHVNAVGHVAGYVWSTAATPYVAMLWKSPTEAVALPPYEPGGGAVAVASNSAGLVVGHSAGQNGFTGRLLLWNTAPPPPTPQQQVAALSAALTSFTSSSMIDAQDAKGLTSKLDAINASLGKGDSPASKNVLKALGNQVGALEKSGRISATTAASLRDLVNAALATL